MSMQDPIADFMTRIRNASAANKQSVSIPYSGVKLAITQVLEDEGYIKSHEVVDIAESKKDIKVNLKYYAGKPVISKIKRSSRPGLRQYNGKKELPRVMGGFGIAIVSTPKGVMSDAKARAAGQGGEILGTVE